MNRATKTITATSAVLLASALVRSSIERKVDPAVKAAVAKVQSVERNDRCGDGQSIVSDAHTVPIHALAASDQVLVNARSVSSFFSSSELAGLSDKKIAHLESLLRSAKRATYDLLIERGKVTKLPGGGIRIEIPAQDSALKEMEDFVRDSVRLIAGVEKTKSLEAGLGPRFEAQFAYFGKYDTVIDLSFDGRAYPSQPAEYVTMRNEYSQVMILGIPSGHIKTTHVLTLNTFESDFMPLSSLKSVPSP